MNVLSILILLLLAVWFVWAVFRIVSGNSSCCGSTRCNSCCGHDCPGCGRKKKSL